MEEARVHLLGLDTLAPEGCDELGAALRARCHGLGEPSGLPAGSAGVRLTVRLEGARAAIAALDPSTLALPAVDSALRALEGYLSLARVLEPGP